MFPFYITCGMDYELYWNGDPRLVIFYRRAYEMGIEKRNQELWLQGLYNFHAISTALSNIHLDGKNHKPNKYIEKPLDLFEKTEEEKKENVAAAKQTVIDRLNALKAAWERKQKG